MKIISTLFLVLALGLYTKAQQTGNFEDNIMFMGQSRNISFHVPTNYDPNINYKVIIGLHGLGDNSANYRNALINSLSWPTIFDSTIFIFPDGGSDQNKDFYEPAGDEAIIAECINYAKQNYSIDTAEIILQGFSLGGRSALKYGLENTSTFKGLLLTTPALQGLLDVQNDVNASLIYPYSNASQIPMYITVGATDQIYTSSIDVLVNILKKNDAPMKFISVNGVGHSVPNSSIISPCIPFFESPAQQDFDLEVFEIDNKERSCDPNQSAGVFVRNIGAQNVSSFDITYQQGGSSNTFSWTGSLDAYEHAYVQIPSFMASGGNQTLSVDLGQVNGNQTDPVSSNNQLSSDFEVVSTGLNLPVNEGFEANEAGWIFEETGSLFEWSKDGSVQSSGQSSVFTFNTILIFNTLGAAESFNSPVMDLSSVATPYLAFDLAFNYHQYTPPYFLDTVNFADTLQIFISTDCGETFQSIYKKGGADLATVDNPIMNPLNIQQCFFTPADSSEWRRERINLSSFSSATEAVVKFSYISALGGSINIDNINFDDASVISLTEDNVANFNMYPNPANNELELNYNHKEVDQLEIYNLGGTLMYQQELNDIDQTRVNLGDLPSGFYLVKLSGNQKESVQKLCIQR